MFYRKSYIDFDQWILVSIIVPTRNEEKRLAMLLKALQRSWYRNLEIIVADYNSEDRTREVAKMYGARVIDIDKPGVGYATYVATQYARGEILIRTDADTIIPPHIIPNTIKAFKDKKGLLVYHVGHFYYNGDIIDNLMAFLYDKYWRRAWSTTGHFIAFKKEVLEKVNFNPKLKYDDDWDFGKRVYKVFGEHVFYFNRFDIVFTSARRIMKTGKLRYMLGYRIR